MKTKMHDQVTNAEYKEFDPTHTFPVGYANKPVVNVNYTQATEYAKWLSQKTGRKFRLPTEAERIQAEATFVADFSNHPLPECPDVGTFGKNADGVTGLLGVTYDWCANPEDIEDPVALGWTCAVARSASTPIPAPSPTLGACDSPQAILTKLLAEQEEINNKIKKVQEAISLLSSL
jgi:hypothetical protein